MYILPIFQYKPQFDSTVSWWDRFHFRDKSLDLATITQLDTLKNISHYSTGLNPTKVGFCVFLFPRFQPPQILFATVLNCCRSQSEIHSILW